MVAAIAISELIFAFHQSPDLNSLQPFTNAEDCSLPAAFTDETDSSALAIARKQPQDPPQRPSPTPKPPAANYFQLFQETECLVTALWR